MFRKYCILITATIDPGNAPNVARSDIKAREEDYYQALFMYSTLEIPIVFCENSNYPSKRLRDICYSNQRNIEFLGFESRRSHLGKGHGEKEIFDYAFAHSDFINNCEYVIKVTGRLFVANLKRMITKIEDESFMVSGNFVRNLTWVDTRFFIVKRVFYIDYFEPILAKYLNEPGKTYIEHCLAMAIHLAMSEGGRFIPLPAYPIYKGINATNNQRYDRGLYVRFKYKIYYYVKLYVFRQSI